MMTSDLLRVIGGILSAGVGLAAAQSVPVVIPSTFQLIPKGPGARHGEIRVSAAVDGLSIEGKVDGPEPQWPATRAELMAKDHIEVWLAAVPEVELPPIGWGNQFGEIDLKSVQECAGKLVNGGPKSIEGCELWFREQVNYRLQFKRLFARQWLVAGNPFAYYNMSAAEVYAQEALANIGSNFFADGYFPSALEPQMKDGVRMIVVPQAKGASGYGFTIKIPYTAFPPSPSLNVSDLWVMVDVFSAAADGKKMGDFATSSVNRKWGEPASFNRLKMDPSLQFELSPCDYPITQQDVFDNNQASFVYPLPAGTKPGARVLLNNVVVVANPAEGYLYTPFWASPRTETRKVFSKPTSNGGFVCGPKLAYSKGQIATKTDTQVSDEGFDSKIMADGWTLVKTGPRADYTPFGSGQCGACPRAQLEIYAISRTGEIEVALKIYQLVGNDIAAADFSFSPDWSRATLFSERQDSTAGLGGPWSAKSYCLNGHSYQPCGEEQNAKPPSPANVKALRYE